MNLQLVLAVFFFNYLLRPILIKIHYAPGQNQKRRILQNHKSKL